jgi:hypothetical protein
MRNLFLIFLSSALLTSCFTSHTGSITSSVALNQDNFFIEESVSGSATATYIFGIGGNNQEALVAQAKRDLLDKTDFSLGSRALANEVLDFQVQSTLGIVTKVTATVTAHVVNFDLSQKTDSITEIAILSNNVVEEQVAQPTESQPKQFTDLDLLIEKRENLSQKLSGIEIIEYLGDEWTYLIRQSANKFGLTKLQAKTMLSKWFADKKVQISSLQKISIQDQEDNMFLEFVLTRIETFQTSKLKAIE